MINFSVLDAVQLDKKSKSSVNYAKARSHIDSAVTCRAERRKLRNAIIEQFGGQVRQGEVVFPDNSKARF